MIVSFHLSLFVLIVSFLIPLTLTKSFTSINFKINVRQIQLNSSSSSWNVACCLRLNGTMCELDFNRTKFSKTLIKGSTSNEDFFVENFLSTSWTYDFLRNESLFCERYHLFRHLSTNHLAFFTYCIVIVGIIFNSCVFLVLIFGSMRRSNSFTLFLALTCFDLLSLASSLFALLFRTVMSYLKTSPPFCKMFGIFFLYFRQCSSTTLLLIAIERCIVIKYPFCRHVFNRFRLPFLATIMFIYVVPIPFDFIFYTSGSLHCEAFDTRDAHRYQIFRGFFTVFTYAMIPFVGISISNFLIIIELKNSSKRFILTNENGRSKHFSSKVIEKRGTTVMLFVASFAFLLLLGPFYVHWCITYLFHNYPHCHFTRNLYENIQVCMGVLHPHLTVVEKGMRECNHAVNFLLYLATSARFRTDFKRICRKIFYQIFVAGIIFIYKHLCFCWTQPSCLATLERSLIETIDIETSLDSNRKNQMAYKTSHYFSNIERRRKNQLLKESLINKKTLTTTSSSLTPATSLNTLAAQTGKTVRTLTWNPYDPINRQIESQRQAARLSKHYSTSTDI